MTHSVLEYIEKFTSTIENSKAFYEHKPLPRNFFDVKNFTEKWSIEEITRFFENVMDQDGLNAVSSGYMGYIPGSGLYPSALADFVAAVTNRFPTYYDISPPAVEMENLVVSWLCQIMGYSNKSGGYLTSGGSTANLIALHVARHTHQLKGVDFARTVVYLTAHTHHSVKKALDVIGLHEAICKNIPVDKNYHMDTEFLVNEIEQDRKSGLLPWVIVGSAGTTNLGSVDPFDDMANIAEKYGLWFHVDAAYGGFFMLTEHGQKKFSSIEKADSIILDPHKGMFIAYGTGAVLIKNKDHLFDTYYGTANYMPNEEDDERTKLSPCNLSFELTRNFRALRVWLPMKIFGVEPFKAALEEKLLLTEYFCEKISTTPNMELACDPDLSIAAFRYVPPHANANEFNLELVERLKKDGRILLTSTKLNENVYIRMACLSNRTHLKHIDLTLQLLTENIESMESSNS